MQYDLSALGVLSAERGSVTLGASRYFTSLLYRVRPSASCRDWYLPACRSARPICRIRHGLEQLLALASPIMDTPTARENIQATS
jgi:hypothetical protein